MNRIKVGGKIGPPGLMADGLHSRTDMLTSLVAAVSLIAGQLEINFDRVEAGIVDLFILSFSLETPVNFWWSLRGRKDWQDRAFRRGQEEDLAGFQKKNTVTILVENMSC